ncbi:hypothetical protein OGZ02_16220 [Brachyspira hyodysenteriae]|nr:hypothetical protein [Brachyspira hyodysenteriae]MDA1470317.1 hypothetical protein [Brachyspira hyodysenteriae]
MLREKIISMCMKYILQKFGNFFNGVLDFSPEGASRRIEQGYNDAKKYLSFMASKNNV